MGGPSARLITYCPAALRKYVRQRAPFFRRGDEPSAKESFKESL